jgi:hypothetical protein
MVSWFAVLGIALNASFADTPPAAPIVEAKKENLPVLKFDKTVFNFGTTSLVQTVSGTFTFENAGTGLLVISNVTAGCGCTIPQVKPPSKQLQPGEKGEISFVLSLGAMRGMLEKHITVKSNDPVTPQANLTIKGTVAVVFDVPMQVMAGELLAGQSTNLTITVKRMDGKPLKLTKVESSDPNVKAELEPATDETSKTANVKVSIKAEGAARPMYSQVSFFAEGLPSAVARTVVYGQIVTEFRIMPEQIFWGISDPKNWPGTRNAVQQSSRTIQLELKKLDSKFQVRSVKTDIKDMDVTFKTIQDGRSYQVVAKLQKAPEVSTKGTITIETDWAERPTVVVPVTINVLARTPVSSAVSSK